ncbi:hypothetical protein CC86DRAFT_420949 [Ophiobolus disseminans]|uniref:Uncharacterized protein n=1 Tax=Ophiobolus disseminans TaxID=1469910 RepID=A0A6A6ZUG2_9PLEO|nr:hypothetical protein CC86DRAFT_420949 [Ophiobolus disseminans]
MDFSGCLYESLRVLMGEAAVPRPTRSGFSFYVPGGAAHKYPPPGLIRGNLPTPGEINTHPQPDTWAMTPHLGVTSHMHLLKEHTNKPFPNEARWKTRLRNTPSNRIIFTKGGKFPVVRISRAKWLPLRSDLGLGSALVIQLIQSPEVTYAYTCVIDARWATGQTMQSEKSNMWSWESNPGIQHFDEPYALSTWSFMWTSMLDPETALFYSKPIRIEQPCLDALAPSMPEASMPGNNLVMTSFEALLNQSGLRRADQPDAGGATIDFEYVTTLFFLNALSRVGLSRQLVANDPASHDLRPELLPHKAKNHTFMDRERYPNATHLGPSSKPTTSNTNMQPQGRLPKKTLIHIFAIFWARRPSSAWESINELLVLAYNSVPRSAAFKNCSGGISHLRTVEKKVRVDIISSSEEGEDAIASCASR